MKHGILLNQKKTSCSIYESGFDIKEILKRNTTHYTLDYKETEANLPGYSFFPYDFALINWHPHTLRIGKTLINRFKCPVIAIVEEVGQDDYLPFTPDWFDAYLIIDPTKKKKDRFYPFPRPLIDNIPTKPLLDSDKLVFGSFGLYSHQFADEKRFGEVITEANKTGRKCIVRINLPVPAFTSTSLQMIAQYGVWLKSLAKANVEVIITHNYMEKNELVAWLSEHNANCFPYYRNRPGLSAVTDQSISAGRGIITTECDTFRHLHEYISYYPKQSYEELVESSVSGVEKMKEDWSEDAFREKFVSMLKELGVI